MVRCPTMELSMKTAAVLTFVLVTHAVAAELEGLPYCAGHESGSTPKPIRPERWTTVEASRRQVRCSGKSGW